MKKSGITFFVVLLIVLSIIAVYSGVPKTHVEYLRIHIRADSNEPSAQQVKYYVKERVVDYLTPYLAECNTKAAAINTLTERMGEIERICCAALKEKGFDYGATARLKSEDKHRRIPHPCLRGSCAFRRLLRRAYHRTRQRRRG